MAKDKVTMTIAPDVLAVTDEDAAEAGMNRSEYVQRVLIDAHYARLLAQATPPAPESLDEQAGLLFKNGRVVRLKPQPFKLLLLLVSRAGEVVTREEIRDALWGSDTFVDFEQGVNSAIKQVREALSEDADRPLYVETIPKRGYRFTAPVEGRTQYVPPRTDLALHKALWLNIAELRLAEEQRIKKKRRLKTLLIAGGILAALTIASVVILFTRG